MAGHGGFYDLYISGPFKLSFGHGPTCPPQGDTVRYSVVTPGLYEAIAANSDISKGELGVEGRKGIEL